VDTCDEVIPVHITKAYVREEIKFHVFLMLVSDGGEWSVSCPLCTVDRELGGPQSSLDALPLVN
jgi:hypothetical protein